MVTTDPDRVSPRVLECVDRLPVVGRDAVKSLEVFCRVRGIIVPRDVPEVVPGLILVLDPDQGPARKLHAIPGSSDRRRHRRKCAEGRLGGGQ